MNVLITGANGYIGHGLAKRLAATRQLADGTPISTLTLLDLRFGAPAAADFVRQVTGSITDEAVLESATEVPPQVVFHLAAIPSGLAETDFELGLNVNLRGLLGLLERLRQQGHKPVVVFSSSIAVYGVPLPDHVNDLTPLTPALSYGAQKQIGEILLANYTRRGWLRARSVRIPGIVMRPPVPNGAWSIFSSDLMRAAAAGQPYECPVGPEATLWLMSLDCALDNLLHAASLPGDDAGGPWTLPALQMSVADLIQALQEVFGKESTEQISYRPRAELQAQFGEYPPLSTPAADAAGFRHDGDLTTLVRRATAASVS